jgi:hypothetical protein
VRGRRADVDADRAQPQPLGRDIARVIVLVEPEAGVRVMAVVVRRWGLRRGR